jgi:hypothetical protein
MSSKKQMVVPLTPREARNRVDGGERATEGVLITPSSEFYSPGDLDRPTRDKWRSVCVSRTADEGFFASTGSLVSLGASAKPPPFTQTSVVLLDFLQ